MLPSIHWSDATSEAVEDIDTNVDNVVEPLLDADVHVIEIGPREASGHRSRKKLRPTGGIASDKANSVTRLPTIGPVR